MTIYSHSFMATRRYGHFGVILLITVLLTGASCSSKSTTNMPHPDTRPFQTYVAKQSCTGRILTFYRIDDRYTFVTAEQLCTDAGTPALLFGTTPELLLCRLDDNIAGTRIICPSSEARAMFKTILHNKEKPDLGLEPDHTITQVIIDKA